VFVSLVTHSLILQTKEVKPAEREVEFVISPDQLKGLLAEVRLQVVDADSQAPIMGDSLQVGPQCQLRRVGPKSEIVLDGLAAGDFDWEIRAPGYEQVFVRFHADPGSTVDLGTIALEKELRVEARVVDLSGAPRSDRIDLCSFDPVTRAIGMARGGIASDGNGALKLEGLGRRTYILRTEDYELLGSDTSTDSRLASGNVLLDMRSGVAPVKLTITLQPTTRLTFTAPDPSLKGLDFRVLDEQGIAIVANIVYGPQPRALALPQGNYRIEVLDAADRPLISKSVTLGSAPVTVELSR
jgi:hypothetical protein